MSFLNKNFFIKFFIIDIIFFLVFYITFVKTFPIKEIVESNKVMINKKTGKLIKYEDISLGLNLSINIKNLEIITLPDKVTSSKKEINKKEVKNTKKESLKLTIKSLSIKPRIMDMISSKRANIDFSADLMNGNINGNFSVIIDKKKKARASKNKRKYHNKFEKNRIFLNLESIDLMNLSKYLELKLPYGGEITGNIETTFATMRGKPIISYLSIDLDMNNGQVGPGKVRAMGSFVTIDAIKLGNFKLKGNTAKNSSKFKFKPLSIDSSDLKANLNGTIIFGRSILPNLKLKFKFTNELLKTNKKVKAVMSGINNLKRKDGYYGIKLTGTLKHLRQRPWRR